MPDGAELVLAATADRRETGRIMHPFLLILLAAWTLTTPARAEAPPAALRDGSRDFDFLFGDWIVQHRVLKAATGAWVEFKGTSSTRPVMGGSGNVEDNLLHPASGTYRAAALRAYDPKTGLWAIWWVDGRNAHGPIDPPVKGRFVNGVGQFYSDDVVDGKPRRTRYTWSEIAPNSARWAQATSSDAGQTWETNWVMEFSRRKTGVDG